MDPGVILAYIFVVVYLIILIVFIDRHNRFHEKINKAHKKCKRKLLSEEKFKKINKVNLKKVEETRGLGFIVMGIV